MELKKYTIAIESLDGKERDVICEAKEMTVRKAEQIADGAAINLNHAEYCVTCMEVE